MGTILLFEILLLSLLAGSYYIISKTRRNNNNPGNITTEDEQDDNNGKNKLTPEEEEALREQERLQQEIAERNEIIEKAKRMALSYDYDGAIELIKSYQGEAGDYSVYTALVDAVNELEAEKSKLVLYGGAYTSVTQVNHIFFHSLIADNSKAFDGDYDSVGYNMYMTTIYEFEKMMEKMYQDGYVLVSIHDLVKKVTDENGKTKYVE